MSEMSALTAAIDKTADSVVKLLVKRNKKIATAESCTGGLISAAITSISGSSQVFDVGICTYANSAKQHYLGVPAQTLDTFGAVSAQTAIYMAKGIRLAAGSDIGISVTGIAGPTGGTPDKPVGTVYVGLSTEKGTQARLALTNPALADNENVREYIRKNTVLFALEWAKKELEQQLLK